MDTQFSRVLKPEDLGLSGQAVRRFFDLHGKLGTHALAVIRDNKVYALSRKPWQVDSPHTLFSLSKSYCSMAAGIAMGEGKINPEDKLVDVLPEVLPQQHDPGLADIQLQHLLSMSSGLDPKSDQRKYRYKKDWAREALVHPVLHPPGTVFHYNTLGTYLAGRMVEKRVGSTLRDYLMPRLFAPLGINKPQWDCCNLGHNLAGIGLHLSVMDIARTAQLLLNRGQWGGQQLLPQAYLDKATTSQVDNRVDEGPNPHQDWLSGYGWQFWMGNHGRYRGDGMYGQVMMMDQQNNLALAVTAGENMMGDQMDALHKLMDELYTLPHQEEKDQKKLQQLEKTLTMPPPPDKGEALINEGTYWTRDGRMLRIETPGDGSLRLIIKGKGQKDCSILSAARGKPFLGQFTSPVMGERPQEYQGQFGVADGVLSVHVYMPQAPYQLRASITKAEDGLLVTYQAVGFDSGSFHFYPAQ